MTDVAHDAGTLPSIDFVEQLEVGLSGENDWGMPAFADTSGVTKISGLDVVGDARIGFIGIAATVSKGGFCVEMIAHAVAMERWAALLEI